MTTNINLGMQGWNHPEWVGRSYPTNISQSGWLAHYASRFPTVEIDDTFYGVPPEPLVRLWRQSVEPGFLFSSKVPQQITHELRFSTADGILKRFLERIRLLDDTLGPLLLIAPLGFQADEENKATLKRFVKLLSTEFKWALELKSESWCTTETIDLLSEENIALVLGESRWIRSATMMELAKRPTADFSYLRWNTRANAKVREEETSDLESDTSVWEDPLVALSGLVTTVHGYFHARAFGDGLRSVKELQYSIDQRRLDTPVSID